MNFIIQIKKRSIADPIAMVWEPTKISEPTYFQEYLREIKNDFYYISIKSRPFTNLCWVPLQHFWHWRGSCIGTTWVRQLILRSTTRFSPLCDTLGDLNKTPRKKGDIMTRRTLGLQSPRWDQGHSSPQLDLKRVLGDQKQIEFRGYA